MGGGKETPRQKMIGLMYLVLMALLAMNVSKEIINAFVTLNNKLESSIAQTESFNTELSSEFATKLATLKATGAPPNEVARVEVHKNTNDEVVKLTRDMCNDLVRRNLYLLISAVDAGTTFEEFEGIEEAIVSDDADAKVKLKALADKVNALAVVAIDEHAGDHGEEHHDEYHNNLFHIDDAGYIHIMDLSGYSKKDDYDTPTRLLAGESFEMIAPEGLHLMENLHHYRNDLIALISNYNSDTMEGGVVYKYEFDTSMIEDPDFLITEQDALDFENLVDSVIDIQVKEHKIAAIDKEAIKNIFVRMTIPKKVLNHGEEYPWIFGQFDHAPIVAASAVMTSVRSDVLQVQTLASQLVASRVKVQAFNFNKIDPLAFSSTSYINQGDSLGLKVMIAAYDSSEAMELRYWVDDTAQISKSHSERNLDNMLTFNGKAGQEVRMSGSVGDHMLVGEIAVKEKGVKKWKPWKFNYAVGAPNAAIANADLMVLYLNWKNKIKVSASGYKPETIKVTGSSGVSITSKADKDGFLICTVKGKRPKDIVTITVSATDDDGKTVELTKEKFRVFTLPKPLAYFGGKASGKMPKIEAGMLSKITASLGDSPLNVPYTVVEFGMYVIVDGNASTLKSRSNKLTPKMKAAVKKMSKGASLTFTGVMVQQLTPSGAKTGKPFKLPVGIQIRLM
ncbi:MAG: GldM family protein [Flavobacteriales bacterium]|nr:GldM family protein [Flavobacteriales bacterium]